jgi:redox-regulated HSP33 family molecular chaperone
LSGELPVGPLIQPEVNDEVEYSSVSFRCMLHSTNVSSVSWKPEGLEYICIYNQTCGIVLLNSKNGRFSCRCQNTKQDELFVELQIDNITEKDHNTNMTCEATSTSKFLRTSAMLLVKGGCI